MLLSVRRRVPALHRLSSSPTSNIAARISRRTNSGPGISSSSKLPLHFPQRRFNSSLCGENSKESSNPQLSFPCLDKLEKRTQSFESGPEPAYSFISSGYETYQSKHPLKLDHGGVIPEFEIAYETWGTLNRDKTNAILLHTGLSASSHAKSHPRNTKPGWWEKFIGPGLSIDTDKYFVICTNIIGGCYGSTGPSSIDPADGNRYATRFPIISVNDMVRAQQRFVTEGLGIQKLYASVGASMGGMQSLAFATEFPENVDRVVSISGCARSHPSSLAMRFVQRQALMADPNWNRGFYYDKIPPHVGMKLAREIATITYRSGPEWEMRFGRDRADPSRSPALCPDFLIETYLDHQGEKFCLEYDPNSLLYVSKAMDLFDLSASALSAAAQRRQDSSTSAATALPEEDIKEQPRESIEMESSPVDTSGTSSADSSRPPQDLVKGMKPMSNHKTLVLGVESDILFPIWQQQEIHSVLKQAAVNQGADPSSHEYVELGNEISLFGHDTFLLSVDHVGEPVKKFLEQ